jgi:DNA polymerase V
LSRNEHQRECQNSGKVAFSQEISAILLAGKLTRAALSALAKIYRDGFRYQKAGVMLLELHPSCHVQASLFDSPDNEASKARMRALDAINARYGRGAIAYAASGTYHPSKLRSEQCSPHYTTVWNDLLAV